MIINFILLHIFFIIKINSKKYITSDLTIKFEKGDSDTYYISNDLIKSTALIYCSLDGAMLIKNGKIEPFKTQLYVIFPENNYPNEYEINLKSTKYSYFFKVYFITFSKDYIKYGINEFNIECFNVYSFNTVYLIFVDSRDLKETQNKMLHYKHIGGNDITLKYFPINNNINWDDLIYNRNYSINETIGNPIYPNDDYFVIKIIGSTFDVYVEYFNGNQFNNSNSIHLFNNQLYKKSINYDYRFNSKKYKIDYIIGTSENCEVEIKKNKFLINNMIN
jgi:hypothetical protein